MAKTQRIDAHGRTIDVDDDDDGVIKNGQGIRVSMTMMDELQRTVFADAVARGAHRSGYQHASSGLVSDGQRAALVDEREQAYDEMVERTQNAWKQAPTRVNDLDFTSISVDPATGFFTGSGKLDPEELAATKQLFRSAPAAASASDAATDQRAAALAERDAWLQDAWKHPG